jgi:dienelactone hydrolase
VAFTFFDDDAFNFEVQNLLGSVRVGCGDVGEILATVATITDAGAGAESWVAAWQALGERVAAIADAAAARHHRISARDAYLRAATYFAAALASVDGVKDPDQALQRAFTQHRRCFEAYVDLLGPAVVRVGIPYEGSTMPGHLFAPVTGGPPRPTVVLNNGSDGAVTSLLGMVEAARARGYNAVTFDGPGQQSMLFDRGIPFRPDWEHVITPIVDFLRGRPEVDPDRIALYGISQAGYWVPRALAHEHRIAAAVVDPGVVDVSTSWSAHLPKEMVTMLDGGDRTTFDQWMQLGASTPQEAQEFAWRAKPYGITDPFDLFVAVRRYRLDPDVIRRITTPLLVTDPEGEQFWPGQSRQLYDSLPAPKQIVSFSAAEGADRHCEPMARSLVEQRVFDWLDETLG